MSEAAPQGDARRAVSCGGTTLSPDGAALVVEDLSVGYHQKDGGVLKVVANVDLKLFPGPVSYTHLTLPTNREV